MLETALNWLKDLPQVWAMDLIRSALLIAVLVVLRVIAARALAGRPHLSLEWRRRWSVNIRNGLIIFGLFGLVVIWSAELQTLAVSMVAIAAALALSLKELIMCFSGSFLRTMSKSYNIGDRIEIGNHRGRVIDINLFGTTILEIGPRQDAHQQTGRAITFPNSLLLTQTVTREDYTGDYLVHVITVPLSVQADVLLAEKLLLAAAQEICAPYLADAHRHMAAIEALSLIDTPSVDPRISINIPDEKTLRLNLRIAVPRAQKQRVEQAILHRFVADFFGHGDSLQEAPPPADGPAPRGTA